MMIGSESRPVRCCLLFAQVASVTAIGIGSLVLVGWLLDITLLKSVWPGSVSMKPNTAICFVLAGIALWSQCIKPGQSYCPDYRRPAAAYICAAAVALVGLLTLAEYLLNLDIGIDELLFRVTAVPGQRSPAGRMAPATALGFFLLGSALGLLDKGSHRGHYPSQYGALFTALIGLIAFLGYLYDVEALRQVFSYSSIALHTSLLFIVLGCGVLFGRPDRPLMAIITSKHAGGVMARRMLPVVIFLPILLAWLRLQGQYAGLYGTVFGLALFATSTIVIFGAVTWATAWFLNQTDVERRRAEEKARYLVQAMERSPDAVIELDLNARITSWNPGATRIFGYEGHEVIGQVATSFFVPSSKLQEQAHLLKRVHLENPLRYEGERINKAGERLDLEISLTPIRDENGILVGQLSISRDVTARKQTEARLLQAKINLEHKVVERTAELQVAKDQAELSNRLKSNFLASMSHELRTPLNAILGFTGVLLMKLPGPLTADQERHLQIVQTSAKHLLSLINDLLDVAKIESGKMELQLEPVVCQSIIEEVATVLGAAAESKGLEFVVSVPSAKVVVQADRRAVSQVLLNLTNNAIKFTDRGAVQLTLSQRQDGEQAVTTISVTDTGRGIKPADQAQLFQAFVQAEADTTQHTPGTGLGLHLSQKLAELLGGRITLQSEYGTGSTFTFTLTRP